MKQQFNISHLLIVFLLFNVQVFAQQKTSLKFIVAPYLTHMTDNSFQVSWETSEAVKGTIYLAESEYDTFEPEFKIAATENTKTHFHRLFIHDLSANELYHYQVINSGKNGDTLKGPVTPITIANYTQSAISFSVVGDTQGNPVVWQRIAELMAQKNPQFIVHVGDLVQYGPNKDDWTDEFFKPANNLLSYTPLYPAIGNHEMNDEKFYEYFGLPFDDAFYSIKKGELILIFVDTNKDILPGSEQYRKLEHLLASSQEQWKIVVHHHPIFTSDKNSYRSSLMAASTKGDPNITHLKNLYESYAVDLTLSGHVHGYERTLPILKNHINKEEGVTHIVSGGGGGRFKRIPYENNWFLAEALHENHYLNISIRENKLQVEAIDTTGVIFDSWKKEKILGHANLSTPLINATKKYFIDSTSVSIENTNKSKSINYRLNEGGYNTAFRNVNSLILYNTTTVSAFASDVNNKSREIIKTVVKLPLMQKQKSAKKAIKADYYEGHFTALPDFENLKSKATFLLDSIALSAVIPRVKDHFAVRFRGSFLIPETDVYRFFLESYDGSRFIIDQKEIINNDGTHYEISKEGFVALEKGTHNFELQYFDYTRRETLNIRIGKQGNKMVDLNRLIHATK